MARVFSALDVPRPIRQALVQVQQRLDDGFNPVDPAQFHVTLQFFEDIDHKQIEKVKQALGAVDMDPFRADVRGIGAFPSLDYITVVWAGLEADELYRLHEQVADHAVPADDTHDFHPHITLLRVDDLSQDQKRELQENIRSLSDTRFGAFTVDHVTLYESELGEDGPVYRELHRTRL